MHQGTHALRRLGREADAIHGLRGEKRRKRNCVCSGGQAYRQPFEMTRVCVRPRQSKSVSAEGLFGHLNLNRRGKAFFAVHKRSQLAVSGRDHKSRCFVCFRCRGHRMRSFGGNLFDGIPRHLLSLIGDQQPRMLQVSICRFTVGDDHRRAESCDGEKEFGELKRQPDTAMARRIARKIARMKRYALPGQPLHEQTLSDHPRCR